MTMYDIHKYYALGDAYNPSHFNIIQTRDPGVYAVVSADVTGPKACAFFLCPRRPFQRIIQGKPGPAYYSPGKVLQLYN